MKVPLRLGMIVIVCLVLSHSALAATQLMYLDCEGDLNDQWNSYDAVSYTNNFSSNIPNTGGVTSGQSCYFDGSEEFVTDGDLDAFNGDVTFSYWVNTATSSTIRFYAGQATIQLNRGTANNQDEKIRLYWPDDDANTLDAYLNTPDTWSDGTWHHHVLTVDGAANNFTVYIDGVQQTTTTTTTNTPDNWAAGGDQTWSINSYRMTGYLDDIKMYDGVVSSAEAANLSSCGLLDCDGGGNSLSVSSGNPVNNDHHNDDPAYFYWNVTSSENITNCTPYIVEDWTNETSGAEYSQAATSTFVLKKTFDLSGGPHKVDEITFMGKHTGVGHTTTVRAEAIWHNGSSTYYDTTGINTNSYELETIDLPNLNVTTLKIYINETDGETAYITNLSVRGNASWQAQTEQTGLANGQHNFSVSLNETTTAWYVYCIDANLNAMTETRTVVYDPNSPDWTINGGNFFSADNSTIINTFDTDVSSLALDLTADDYWLFGNEILIYNASGALVYNDTDTNLTVSSKDFTETVNLIGYGLGQYNVTLTATDDHTAKWIPDYDWTATTQYIEFTTDTGVVVRIENRAGNMKGISAEKEVDRYTFSFEPQNARKEFTFRVTSSEPLHDRTDLWGYPGFVTGAHWVDFLVEGGVIASNVSYVDAYTAEITVTRNESSKEPLTFRSIGGLNTRTESYSFTLTRDATPRQIQNLSGTPSISTVALSWDKTANTTGTALYRDGLLIYNGTAATYNVTGLNSSTSYQFWALAWYNDSGTIYTNTTSSNENNISVQTSFNGSISLEIRDEVTESLITGVTLYVSLIGTNNITETTTTGLIDIINVSTDNYTIRVGGGTYGTRDVYQLIEEDQNASVVVYLLNASERTAGDVTVLNADGSEVGGSIVTLERYSASNNTYRVVQMATTNDEGTAVMVAQIIDAQYRFTVTVDDAVVYQSSSLEVLSAESDGLWHKLFVLGDTGGDAYHRHQGFSYSFEPSSFSLVNGTVYEFNFTIDSDIWNITNCTLSLRYANGTAIDSTHSFCSASGGTGTITYNTTYGDRLLLNASVTTAYFTNTYRKDYTVGSEENSGFTLKTFFDDITSFSGSGFSSFARFIIAFTIIAVLTIGISTKTDLISSPEEILLFVFLCSLLFSYINWLYLDIEGIPFESMKQYGMSVLLGFATITSLLRKWGVGR